MKPTRRSMLVSAASFATAAVLTSVSRSQGAASASAPATTTAATTQANGKPNIAVIGCGGMTRFHGGYLPKYTNVVAVCDVDRSHADSYNKDIAGGKAFDALAIAHPDGTPAHAWYVFPEMTPDEVVAFRTYDTELVKEGKTWFTPHSAFPDPDVEAGKPARFSIELRVMCLFM